MPLFPSERSPLLDNANQQASTSRETIEGANSNGVEPQQARSFGKEISGILAASVPVILAYTLQNSIQTVSVLVVGRLGPGELSAAAFAMMLAMVTAWCVALGGTTALDTLGSQAFTGSTSVADVSIHFQRCIVLMNLLLIPVVLLWAYCRPLLLLLGQEERLSHDVQSFLRVLIIGAPGYLSFETLKKYLQCQGIMKASTYVLCFTSPVNIALNVLLVHKASLGFLGAPLAISLTYWLSFLILAIFTTFSPTHRKNKTWTAIQIAKLFDVASVVEMLKLAIPGIIMVGTEWWAFEIVAIAAGRLGSLPLAAQSVVMTTDQVLNTIPFGIGVAASQRVGNLIGAKKGREARKAAHAAALLSAILGGIVMTIMLIAKDVYGYAFSDDVDVVSLVARVMPLVASFQVADGLAGSCGGVLRGQGRQHLGAFFNIVAYYLLALPLGLTLAFKFDQGLQGLWIGQVVALFIVGLSEYGMVWLGTDWEKEITRAAKRVALEHRRRGNK